MIDVVRLWKTINQLVKTETSGYQSQEEFNNDLATVQTELITLLAPYYSVNKTVKDLLYPFTLSSTTSAVSGLLDYPTGYFTALNASINGYPCYPIAVNEKDIIMRSPIRKASVTTNTYYYYQEDNKIKLLPEVTLTVKLTYLKYPATASIVLTPVSDADNDYLSPSVGTNLAWNENAFPFILFMMLERLGVELKESFSVNWASLGIQKETSKI